MRAPVLAGAPPPIAGPMGTGVQAAVPVQTHLRLSGAYLLTSSAQGPTAVPGLRIDVDEEQIVLSKSDGTTVWASPWAEVAELATPERSTLPDGSSGVVLVVTTVAGRVHRFVVPSNSPASLEGVIAGLGRRHGLTPLAAQAPTSPLLAGAVVVVVGAVVAVLLLAADHVIHL